MPKEMDLREAVSQEQVFSGMTLPEYERFVKKFMRTPAEGMKNLKRGEAFYLPMVEVISYLTNNGFKVYIDSACGADTTRELIRGVIPIPLDRLLVSDFNFTTTGMGKDNPHDHFFDRFKEKIIISGKPLKDNAKTIKIFSILNQIGKKKFSCRKSSCRSFRLRSQSQIISRA